MELVSLQAEEETTPLSCHHVRTQQVRGLPEARKNLTRNRIGSP